MSLAVVGATHLVETVTVRAEGGVITAVGADVAPEPGDEVVDGTGRALLPGLVNGHTHAAMTLMRGFADDLPLKTWLEERVWPVEAKLTGEDVYWGTRLACAEMTRTGTVLFWDMYWQVEDIVRAVHDAGVRAAVAHPLVDFSGAAVADFLKDGALALLDATVDDPLVTGCLGPHAIYTASEPLLEWTARTSAERDVPVHIHLSEDEHEVTDCVAEHGVRPVEYLDRLGLLTPRTVLAHCVFCDDRELALIAERGATIVTNPSSNLKLGIRSIFPYVAARAHGVPVGLGTDGAASNNALDLLSEVKLLALLQKHATGDPEALPAHEAWDVVTGRLAPALGSSGRVEAGQPADLVLVRADAVELTPGDLVTNLVYAASGSVVDATVVAGRVLMREGSVPDESDIRREALARARRLGTAKAASDQDRQKSPGLTQVSGPSGRYS